MKAIPVRPPYSWSVTYGDQRTISKGWSTNHRGTVAIYAGHTWDRGADDDPRIQTLRSWHRGNVPTGAVVAVAELIDGHEALRAGALECCHPWGDPGMWHLVLADEVLPLARPVRCDGRPTMFSLPDEVAAAVLAQFEAVDR